MTAGWKKAFRDNRWLLATLVYSAAVLGEAAWCDMPLAELWTLYRFLCHSIVMAAIFIGGLYAGTFAGLFACAPKGRRLKAAVEAINTVTADYAKSGRFAQACFGFAVIFAGNVFLVSKSLIYSVNPFYVMKWDETFAAWDKALHFGMYPHEFVIPFVNALGMGVALDRLYMLWMMAMLVVFGYCLFADANPVRRMRFLWCYFLSWALLGTGMATWLSSVGPMFYRDYLSGGDMYDAVLLNLSQMNAASGMYAEKARQVLLGWSKNDVMFDANAISAMPSMHVAICWLIVLYLRSFGRLAFALALLLCIGVLTGSVYLGFHYAVDGYVSIVAVSVIWFALGFGLKEKTAEAAT